MATIKTQLEASGVSQFRQQMQQASGAVKAMGAELKVAEAAYKQTGDQAAYLAEKSDILKQQLEEQKKAVSAAEKALETVKKQYGEGSTQVNEWRKKLADARATMIQTETAIRDTDAALDALGKDDVSGVASDLGQVDQKAQGAKRSAGELGVAVGGIAQKLDVQTITAGIDKITGWMDKAISKAAQMGKAVWTASTDAANWADATRDAATAAHMSTTEYQRLGYAAQFFGASVETLTKTQGRVSKAMNSTDDEVIEVGDNLVNTMEWVTDAQGNYIRQKRSWSDVLLDTLDSLGEIEDASERDALAMELFGKSYSDLNGIIAGGTDAFRQRMNEAPVVSEDTVNNLADTADAIKDMDSKLQVLKMELLNALAPSIETIANAIGTLADNLTKFLQTEEGQQLLKDLGKAIEDIVKALTGDGDFSTVVETAKKAIEDLTGALGWLSEHKDGVMGAITGIAIAFGVLKTASAGIKAAETVASFRRLLGIGGGNAGTGGGGGGDAGTAAGAAGTGLGAKLAGAASNAWWSLGVPAGVLTAAIAPSMWAHDWNVNETEARINAVMQKTEKDAAVLGEEATQFSEVIGIAAGALGIDRNDRNFLGQVKLSDPAKVSEALHGLQPYAEFLSTIMDARHMEELNKYWNDTSTLDPFEVTQLLEDVMTTTSDKLSTAAAGLDASAPAVTGAASGLVDSAIAVLNGATAALNRNAGSTAGYGAFSANANLYIGTYNQNGGSDASALASAVATAQSQLRRGYGARR